VSTAIAARIRRWLRLGVACCTLAAAPRLARAEAPSIVLFGLQGSLSSQIEAELSSLGFHVLMGAATPTLETTRELQAAARRAGAAAAVSLQPSEQGVEVWLVDRVTGKTLSRELLQSEPGLDRERVIAVRIVELLRASLLELQLPSGAEGEVPATPQLQALAGLPDPSLQQKREQSSAGPPAVEGYGALRLHAGLGLASSVGATRVTPLLGLGAFWQALRSLAIGVSGSLPLGSAQISDREGSARVTSWQLNLGPRLYPFAATGAFRLFLDLGVSLLQFQIDATEEAAPLVGSSDRLLTAGANAGLGVEWRLSSHFSLCSTVGAGVATPKPVVRFAGRDVLTLARPLLSYTLGVEFRPAPAAQRDW
jgi:hypothetical protein